MKMLQSGFWVNFGSMPQKNTIFGSLLCLFTDQHIGNTFRCLCLVFLYDMGVKAFGGGDACVAELL